MPDLLKQVKEDSAHEVEVYNRSIGAISSIAWPPHYMQVLQKWERARELGFGRARGQPGC